jgi:hypothetical protein
VRIPSRPSGEFFAYLDFTFLHVFKNPILGGVLFELAKPYKKWGGFAGLIVQIAKYAPK